MQSTLTNNELLNWSTDVNLFHTNMVDVLHYPTDGWIVENLKRYITNQSQLDEWFNHFALAYDCDFDKLDQCCIDFIVAQEKSKKRADH